MSTPAIRVAHVTKTYGPPGAAPFVALDDVSLEVDRGDFVALLGPSGCGKSTLLHAIAGLTPASGEISVNGAAVKGPGHGRGIVFQDYALFPWRRALENVTFGLEVRGVSRTERERIAREHLALVGLGGFEDRFPSQLSGGMKQRVAIARALACDPDVLLMDEPFAALDAQTRETLQEELLRIWERTHKTIVFVTHAIDEALFLAQRVAVMSARPGRIKEIVPVDLHEQRWATDVRGTAAFAALRHRLRETLAAEVERAREQALLVTEEAAARRRPGTALRRAAAARRAADA